MLYSTSKCCLEGVSYLDSIVFIMSRKPPLSTTLYGRKSFAIKRAIDAVIALNLAIMATLRLERVFYFLVFVLPSLFCACRASCATMPLTRILPPMPSRQVIIRVCCTSSIFDGRSTKLAKGKDFVKLFIPLKKIQMIFRC